MIMRFDRKIRYYRNADIARRYSYGVYYITCHKNMIFPSGTQKKEL